MCFKKNFYKISILKNIFIVGTIVIFSFLTVSFKSLAQNNDLGEIEVDCILEDVNSSCPSDSLSVEITKNFIENVINQKQNFKLNLPSGLNINIDEKKFSILGASDIYFSQIPTSINNKDLTIFLSAKNSIDFGQVSIFGEKDLENLRTYKSGASNVYIQAGKYIKGNYFYIEKELFLETAFQETQAGEKTWIKFKGIDVLGGQIKISSQRVLGGGIVNAPYRGKKEKPGSLLIEAEEIEVGTLDLAGYGQEGGRVVLDANFIQTGDIYIFSACFGGTGCTEYLKINETTEKAGSLEVKYEKFNPEHKKDNPSFFEGGRILAYGFGSNDIKINTKDSILVSDVFTYSGEKWFRNDEEKNFWQERGGKKLVCPDFPRAGNVELRANNLVLAGNIRTDASEEYSVNIGRCMGKAGNIYLSAPEGEVWVGTTLGTTPWGPPGYFYPGYLYSRGLHSAGKNILISAKYIVVVKEIDASAGIFSTSSYYYFFPEESNFSIEKGAGDIEIFTTALPEEESAIFINNIFATSYYPYFPDGGDVFIETNRCIASLEECEKRKKEKTGFLGSSDWFCVPFCSSIRNIMYINTAGLVGAGGIKGADELNCYKKCEAENPPEYVDGQDAGIMPKECIAKNYPYHLFIPEGYGDGRKGGDGGDVSILAGRTCFSELNISASGGDGGKGGDGGQGVYCSNYSGPLHNVLPKVGAGGKGGDGGNGGNIYVDFFLLSCFYRVKIANNGGNGGGAGLVSLFQLYYYYYFGSWWGGGFHYARKGNECDLGGWERVEEYPLPQEGTKGGDGGYVKPVLGELKDYFERPGLHLPQGYDYPIKELYISSSGGSGGRDVNFQCPSNYSCSSYPPYPYGPCSCYPPYPYSLLGGPCPDCAKQVIEKAENGKKGGDGGNSKEIFIEGYFDLLKKTICAYGGDGANGGRGQNSFTVMPGKGGDGGNGGNGGKIIGPASLSGSDVYNRGGRGGDSGSWGQFLTVSLPEISSYEQYCLEEKSPQSLSYCYFRFVLEQEQFQNLYGKKGKDGEQPENEFDDKYKKISELSCIDSCFPPFQKLPQPPRFLSWSEPEKSRQCKKTGKEFTDYLDYLNSLPKRKKEKEYRFFGCDIKPAGFVLANYGGKVKAYSYKGNGIFEPSFESTASYLATSIASADFNRDGAIDFVIGTNTDDDYIFFNKNEGKFDFYSGSYVPYSRDKTQAVAVADFNFDGFEDYIAGNRGENKIYLNKGGGRRFEFVFSDGLFLKKDICEKYGFSYNSSTGRCEADTRALGIGDFDSDGCLDYICGTYGQPNKVYFCTNIDPLYFELGSVEDKEISKIKCLNEGYRYDETKKVCLRPNISEEKDKTNALVVGDLDNDGDFDYIAGNEGEERVYLNNGKGIFSLSQSFGNDLTYSVALGDLDKDGDLDLVTGNEGDFKIYLNNGKGNFSEDKTIKVKEGKVRGLSLFDFDFDGNFDIVAGIEGDQSRVYFNDGNNNFYLKYSTPEADQTYGAVSFLDLKADKFLDFIFGSFISEEEIKEGKQMQPIKIYYFDENEQTISSTSITQNVSDIKIADLNLDGILDFIATNYNGKTAIFLGICKDKFKLQQMISSSPETNSVAVADLNADKWPDLILGNKGKNEIYFNNKSGKFVLGGVSSDNDDTREIVIGDINGDGFSDYIAGNFKSPSKVYLNDGTGKFIKFSSLPSDPVTSLVLADFDNNNSLDLFVGNYGGKNKLYLNDGRGHFSLVWSSQKEEKALSLGVEDFNFDNYLDIVVGKESGTDVYFNNKQKGFFVGFSEKRGATYSLAVGDFDENGSKDFIVGKEGYAMIYLNIDGEGDFRTGKKFDNLVGKITALATDYLQVKCKTCEKINKFFKREIINKLIPPTKEFSQEPIKIFYPWEPIFPWPSLPPECKEEYRCGPCIKNPQEICVQVKRPGIIINEKEDKIECPEGVWQDLENCGIPNQEYDRCCQPENWGENCGTQHIKSGICVLEKNEKGEIIGGKCEGKEETLCQNCEGPVKCEDGRCTNKCSIECGAECEEDENCIKDSMIGHCIRPEETIPGQPYEGKNPCKCIIFWGVRVVIPPPGVSPCDCFLPEESVYTLSAQYQGALNMAKFQIQIDDQSDFSSPEVDKITFVNPVLYPNNSIFNLSVFVKTIPSLNELTYKKSYYWRTKVWDWQNNESEWAYYEDPNDFDKDGNPKTFSTPSHPLPFPEFKCRIEGEENIQDCESLFPYLKVGQKITFVDQSRCWTDSFGEYSCKYGDNVKYTWNFGDESPLVFEKGDVSHIYSRPGIWRVTLSVEDDAGACQKTHTLFVGYLLPQWKEISPY